MHELPSTIDGKTVLQFEAFAADPSRSISGQQQQQSDSKPASATTSETGPGEGKETERSSTACKSEIAFPPKQTSSSGFGLTQAQTDHFGNGMLVRPKARSPPLVTAFV